MCTGKPFNRLPPLILPENVRISRTVQSCHQLPFYLICGGAPHHIHFASFQQKCLEKKFFVALGVHNCTCTGAPPAPSLAIRLWSFSQLVCFVTCIHVTIENRGLWKSLCKAWPTKNILYQGMHWLVGLQIAARHAIVGVIALTQSMQPTVIVRRRRRRRDMT